MTTDERIAALLEHGRGCPQAVKLGGPANVEAWLTQQELDVEAELADAEQAALPEEEQAAYAAVDDEATTAAAEARAAEAVAAEEDVEVTAGDTPEDEVVEDGGILEPIRARLAALEDTADTWNPSILARLESLERAVDALAVAGPPEDTDDDVGAGDEPPPQVTPGKPKKGRKKTGRK